MDPNAAIARMRYLSERADSQQLTVEEGFEMCELFSGLDQWLAHGGFLPAEWSTRRAPPRRFPSATTSPPWG